MQDYYEFYNQTAYIFAVIPVVLTFCTTYDGIVSWAIAYFLCDRDYRDSCPCYRMDIVDEFFLTPRQGASSYG